METDLFQFSKDIYYYLLLSTIATFGICVSGISYYVIFCVKNSKIGKYKYYLINITTWNFIVCINGTMFVRKDNAHGVPNFAIIRGVARIFNSQFVAHIFGLIEHIATAQIGIAIVVCCFFKFLHLAVMFKSDREFTLKKLVFIAAMVHAVSILTIGIPGILMYCPNDLIYLNITEKYPEMIEIFATQVVTNFYTPCNRFVGIFNNVRMIHVCIVFICIMILMVWSSILLRTQRSVLPSMTYQLQKMMIRTLIIHAIIPLFCTVLLYASKPLAMLGLVPTLSSEVITVSLLILYSSTVVNNALTIYSIKPYRVYLVKKMINFLKKDVSPVTSVTPYKSV